VKVIDSIADKRTISFGYRNAENHSEQRVLEPFGVGTKNGHWYVAGRDLDKSAVRLFRLDRIDGEVKEQGKANSFTIPLDFAMNSLLASKRKDKTAIVDIRVNKGFKLRKHGKVLSSDTEWDRCEISFSDLSEFIADVLWHRDDAKIVEPQSAIDLLLESLSTIGAGHV
jgi:proteasome accessory factor B